MESKSTKTPEKNPKDKIEGVNHYSAGLEFGLTIIVFCGIGWWLDSALGTMPLLLIVCTFVGFGGALFSLVRKVSR